MKKALNTLTAITAYLVIAIIYWIILTDIEGLLYQGLFFLVATLMLLLVTRSVME